jgi:hypothetical protein
MAAIGFVGSAPIAAAQGAGSIDSLLSPPPVPAQAILDARDDLKLTDAQLTRLQTLARTQVAGLVRMTASYLRAEADLLDATRKDDLAIRRLALEKRARIAIDGEIARLQGEKDARAVLAIDQRDRLQAMLDQVNTRPLRTIGPVWTPLVAPSQLALRFGRDSVVRDSGTVRLKVIPSYAEIFIDGINIGTNFKQVMVPIGAHTVRFQAPGCGRAIEQQITVIKGQLLIIPPVTIPGC